MGSQNNRVKVSGQAMQNLCFRRKDTRLHAKQRTKCALVAQAAALCSDLGKTHERDDIVSRPCAKADSIIVLNQGEIVEQGTWQALLSPPGSLFARLDAGAS